MMIKYIISLGLLGLSYGVCANTIQMSKPELEQAYSFNLPDLSLADQPLVISNELPPLLMTIESNTKEDIQKIEYLIYQKDWKNLEIVLKNYAKEPQHDPILLQFATARLYRGQGKPEKSLNIYRDILKNHPDFTFVRLAYAEGLFESKQYENAQQQFKIINPNELLEQTHLVVQSYLKAIEYAKKAQFHVNLNYLESDNINQASSSKTIELLGKTFEKSQDSLPKSANGLNYELGIKKIINLKNHWYLDTSLMIDGLFYFNQHDYDEQNLSFNTALQYKTSKNTWQMIPLIQYSRFADESYNQGYGLQLSQKYQITPALQSHISHTIRWIYYHDYPSFDGLRQNSQMSFLFQTPQYHLFSGISYGNDRPKNQEYHADRLGFNLGGEYHWNNMVGIRGMLYLSERKFDREHGLANIIRHDKERFYQVSLFSPKLSYKQWLPMLNWSRQKVISNIPNLYSNSTDKLYLSIYHRF